MGKIIRGFLVVFLLGAGPFFFGACGIDDYVYLSPVQESEINIRSNTQATIRLPSPNSSEVTYFTHFAIFYRIYISSSLQSGQITPELMRTVNTTLYSDYNGIFPSSSNNSSNSTSTTNTAVGSIFSSRRYYDMDLEGAAIESVLDKDSQGETLLIEFSSADRPFLTLGGGRAYALYRSNGGGAFDPKPDRYFVNHSDLTSGANLTASINADVAGPSPSGSSYTYVSMYIVKAGRDPQSLASVYSAPTFIGVFKLPSL
jgi:hypothetical protein